jgi:uncharacterized membrane protein YoaK (UPF0700 family)
MIFLLIVLSAFAMGVQSAAVRRLGVPGIATTFVTGTLTSLMVDLLGWLRSIAAQLPGSKTAAASFRIHGISVWVFWRAWLFCVPCALISGVLVLRTHAPLFPLGL